MQKCLNDLFGGFCSGEPQIESTEEFSGTGPKGAPLSAIVRKCSLLPKECGFYKKFSEVVKPAVGLGPARINIKKGTETKPKPKHKEPSKQGALL